VVAADARLAAAAVRPPLRAGLRCLPSWRAEVRAGVQARQRDSDLGPATGRRSFGKQRAVGQGKAVFLLDGKFCTPDTRGLEGASAPGLGPPRRRAGKLTSASERWAEPVTRATSHLNAHVRTAAVLSARITARSV
jgi:hypothetical protein